MSKLHEYNLNKLSNDLQCAMATGNLGAVRETLARARHAIDTNEITSTQYTSLVRDAREELFDV